jgi:hypothetical protein
MSMIFSLWFNFLHSDSNALAHNHISGILASYSFVHYLMTVSALRRYRTDARIINEYGTVGGMGIDRGN